MNDIQISLITDPDDPRINFSSYENYINEKNIHDIIANLENGRILSQINSKDLNGISGLTTSLNSISGLTTSLNYIPLALTLHKDTFLNSDKLQIVKTDEITEIIQGLRDILQVLIGIVCNVNVTFIEILEREDYYTFTPYTELSLVYMHPDFNPTEFLDPEKYVGYKLLSVSSLTRYVLDLILERLPQTNEEIEENVLTARELSGSAPELQVNPVEEKIQQNINETEVRYIKIKDETIAIIKISSFYENMKEDEHEPTDFVGEVNDKIADLVSKGYFNYPFGVFDVEDHELIIELCEMFNIEIIDSRDLSNLILRLPQNIDTNVANASSPSDVDFRITPREWLFQNLQRIKNGEYPLFTFYPQIFYGDYNRLYGKSNIDIILKYATNLVYAELSDEHEIIKPFARDIQVHTDLSVTVALPTYDLVKDLKERLQKKLKSGISLGKQDKVPLGQLENNRVYGAWNIEPCKNLKEGIIKRWIVQTVDDDAYPMIFKDFTNNEVLIHRSKKGIQYPSPFNFSKNNMEEAEHLLQTALVTYYTNPLFNGKICHDDLEVVTLETISEMNLDDLLKLIPITESVRSSSKDQITYCFSAETLSKLENKINPVTRSPISEEILSQVNNLELGLRGLFDVGPLFGLYSEYPKKVLVPPIVNNKLIGIPNVVRVSSINTDHELVQKERELVGSIYLIEILFEDGTSTPLFEISLPTIGFQQLDNLKEVVNELWDQGFFLSYWTSAIQKYLIGKSSRRSYSVLIQNPILLNANSSIKDGERALEYLNSLV